MANPDINKAWQWAVNTCNAPNVGYSQANRDAETINGITYYDCSSFIWYALVDGGFYNILRQAWYDAFGYYGGAFWTATMGAVLVQAGFQAMSTNQTWLPGDILVRDGHTEMCYQSAPNNGLGGITMGARDELAPLPDQVSILNFVESPSAYTTLYRWGSGGSGQGYGSSLEVISAICGNWYQESQLNPGLWEGQTVGQWTDEGKGYGLGQWTNAIGSGGNGRLKAFYDWMITNNYSTDDGDGQIQYFFHENTWYTQGTGLPWANDYPTLASFMRSTDTDINRLTECFLNCWEGLSSTSQWAYLSQRQQYAQDIYNYLSANYNVPANWITNTGYITWAESLNNSLMIYRALSAGSGGGGNIPSLTVRKMPIWMMLKYF